jgi:hypothetical protein
VKHPDTTTLRAIGHQAEQSARTTAEHPVVTRIARWGFATRGVLYLIIGGLALKAALGAGGATTDNPGAIATIYQQPFGRLLVTLVAVGFVVYALWLFIQAALDTEGYGTQMQGIGARIGAGVLGCTYLGLAALAFGLVTHKRQTATSTDKATQDWTARLLAHPFGVILVVLAGLIVLGIAGFFVWQAVTARFRDHLDLSRPWARTWALPLGRIGYAALALADLPIGIFLIIAAVRRNAGEAKGLGGALATLAQQPFGRFLLAVVALGLIVYGLYSFVEAYCRRLVAPSRATS